MINYLIKTLKSKKHRKVSAPGSWEEVTVAQYMALVSSWDRKDVVQAFAILTGQSFRKLTESTSFGLENRILASMEWILDAPNWDAMTCPSAVEIEGKMVEVPVELDKLTLGQKMEAMRKMSQAKNLEECVAFVCAVYLQPERDSGKFNLDSAKELEKVIEGLPIVVFHPIAVFFFEKLGKSMRNGRSVWHPLILTQIASGLMLQGWRALTVWLRSQIWLYWTKLSNGAKGPTPTKTLCCSLISLLWVCC